MHNLGFAFSEGIIRVTCGRGKNFMNHINEVVFNSMPEVCDRTFLKFVFAPDGITVILVK